MSVRNTIWRLAGGLTGRSREEKRATVQNALRDLFQKLETATQLSFGEGDMIELDLHFFDPDTELSQPARNQFFRPWPLSKLREHEKNLEIKEAKDRLETMESIMEADNLGLPVPVTDGNIWRKLRHISCRLVCEMEVFPRQGTEGNRQPLTRLTHWRYTDGLPFDEDLRSEFVRVWDYGNKSPRWSCDHSWTLARDKPHVKLCMYNGVTADPQHILRGELLSIVAIMLTRLRMEKLKKHVTIPVMLCSFVAPCSGRILLAHFDGARLVIQQSPLYPFHVKDDGAMLLFTRYLASDVGPDGATKSLESDT
ncbi:uncharacterized protein N7459_004867 [Penicillium hispanicum]|uniref:uncharacterized protein n=1 Tax=Penicillium hispanicum TaxID=1080232 RepID=UPI00254191E3|nr:uncharacterized protein N7459_004867 [Penicillium hispanicum]KAJ5585067.1 hypothetical protein N7459_004867 [Penicillium hispanicum]